MSCCHAITRPPGCPHRPYSAHTVTHTARSPDRPVGRPSCTQRAGSSTIYSCRCTPGACFVGSPFGPDRKSKASHPRLSHAHLYETHASGCGDVFKKLQKNLNEKCCLCCTHRRRHGKPSGYLYKSVQGRTEQVQNIALPCPSWSIQRIGPRVDWFHMLIKTLRPSPTPMMTMAITHATQSRSLFSALARVDPSLPPFLNPSLNPLTN